MTKTISLTDETYEKLYQLITERRMKALKQKIIKNYSFNDIIEKLIQEVKNNGREY